MVKCTLCNQPIAELFLGKLKGTVVKKKDSKKQYPICFSCQKKYPSKEEILSAIP